MLFNGALLYKLWSLEAHTTIQLLTKQQHYHSYTGSYHKRIVRQVLVQTLFYYSAMQSYVRKA